MPQHQIFQQPLLTMKEMPALGHHHQGQVLRAAPIQRGGNRHGVVVFTMNQQSAFMPSGRNRLHGKTRSGCAHQHQVRQRALPLVRNAAGCLANNMRAKRKPRQGDGCRKAMLLNPILYRQAICQLTDTMIVLAL